jgi:hypothetical protein
MAGIFHCPILYIAHETGLSLEGASKGLARLLEVDFCTFEAETDTVFVHEMAKYQIGEELKPNDNRVIGVQKQYASMADSPMKTAFFDRYKNTYFLVKNPKPLPSPSKAPTKPETETETETDTSAFAEFWSVYPKKKNKGDAEKAFQRLKIGKGLLQTILRAVEVASQSDDWRKSGGQFIPYPASWLNAKGWEDEHGASSDTPIWER